MKYTLKCNGGQAYMDRYARQLNAVIDETLTPVDGNVYTAVALNDLANI